MNGILFWLLPPLIGAFIGYFTNAVAIKMLFRPLKEVKFFGIRLPFTPGILPRERKKLANSIGRMVDKELLTPDVIRERLSKTEVRQNIENVVGSYTGEMLDRPLSFWMEDRPDDFPMAELLRDFVNSDIFDTFLEEILKNWIMGKSEISAPDKKPASWIKSLLKDVGSLFVPAAKNMIKNGLSREIQNDEGKETAYSRALLSIIEKYPGITGREFLSMGKKQKQRLDSFLAGKTTDTLDDNIESALFSVDIKTLVSDRINSLDMIRVEKIILDVMAGQLKWINFFGAILGAIIGFLQIIISFFYK